MVPESSCNLFISPIIKLQAVWSQLHPKCSQYLNVTSVGLILSSLQEQTFFFLFKVWEACFSCSRCCSSLHCLLQSSCLPQNSCAPAHQVNYLSLNLHSALHSPERCCLLSKVVVQMWVVCMTSTDQEMRKWNRVIDWLILRREVHYDVIFRCFHCC